MITSDSAFYALCRRLNIICTRLKPGVFAVSKPISGYPYSEVCNGEGIVTLRGQKYEGGHADKIPWETKGFTTIKEPFEIVKRVVCNGKELDETLPDEIHGWTVVKGVSGRMYYFKNGKTVSYKKQRVEREKRLHLVEQRILAHVWCDKDYNEDVADWFLLQGKEPRAVTITREDTERRTIRELLNS